MEQAYESHETLSQFHDFHEGYYDYGSLSEKSQTRTEFERGLQLLERHLGFAPGKKILDVGFGNGFFLALAKQRGWQVDGVDTSAVNAANAKRKYGLSLRTGKLGNLNSPEGSYDAISFWDVIEHFSDPQVPLAQAGKLLKEGGYLLIGVPPHEAPKAVKESGLTNESGWIPVDRQTLETRYPGVYAIGDVATIPIAQGKTLPKAGIFAHYQAEIVAANILSRLNHQPEKGKFDGAGWCAIEMGSGVAAFGNGEFYAPNGAEVRLYRPDRFWHLGRVLFEKWWLSPFSIKRKILRLMLKLGARMRGISVSL